MIGNSKTRFLHLFQKSFSPEKNNQISASGIPKNFGSDAKYSYGKKASKNREEITI